MFCWKDIIMSRLGVVVLGLLVALGSAQKTFQRSCDCEYTIDGKCAYTLLLPLASEGGQCSPGEGNGGAGNTEELEDHVAQLQENFTNFITWSSEQLRMLSQLQSSVLLHQASIDELKIKVNETGDAPSDEVCAQCDALQVSLTAQTLRIDIINDSLEIQKLEIREIKTNVAAAQNRIGNFMEGVENLQADFRKGIEEAFCSDKGLLVSGEKYSIENADISSSSDQSEELHRVEGRIRSDSAWCPEEPNNDEEWLQFDLGSMKAIYGVVTRGRDDYAQWVTSFKMMYSNRRSDSDEIDWTTYQDPVGFDQVFAGNSDRVTANTNMLWQPVKARYIRLVPISAYQDSNKCMRADIIGCMDDD